LDLSPELLTLLSFITLCVLHAVHFSILLAWAILLVVLEASKMFVAGGATSICATQVIVVFVGLVISCSRISRILAKHPSLIVAWTPREFKRRRPSQKRHMAVEIMLFMMAFVISCPNLVDATTAAHQLGTVYCSNDEGDGPPRLVEDQSTQHIHPVGAAVASSSPHPPQHAPTSGTPQIVLIPVPQAVQTKKRKSKTEDTKAKQVISDSVHQQQQYSQQRAAAENGNEADRVVIQDRRFKEWTRSTVRLMVADLSSKLAVLSMPCRCWLRS
jgi:hypothetical protein